MRTNPGDENRMAIEPLSELELTGRASSHVLHCDDLGCPVHRAAIEPLRRMRIAAEKAGIALRVVSGFRDFERQRQIWNQKFRGERPVMDSEGREVDVLPLDSASRVALIMVWSALPGASRHHFGSEVDLVDGNALAAGHKLQLIPAEYAGAGPFAALSGWLDEHAARFGFYRPYENFRGGVRPEPWHLSYAPVAVPSQQRLDSRLLRETIEAAQIDGKEAILAELETLHARYCANVDPAPGVSLRPRLA
ncbi:MAG: M15 family metallopeptidase [Steroidobacteraceae bacterium]